ncbi:hypothetical protein [Peribacillus sp. R9-11]|uniref:hypothetical protein n=1 Tax=Peribacillus sp. R9-11 TaxID=3073271 RepID=UPI0028693474|nr:hypothetical protein [Peribacillus sp. R9-11]WMX57438.1 hypothetical protein RE409_09555 [Peribacillus sp. R9-11]
MKYEVHIGLKNGQSYTFFVIASSKDEIINHIINKHGNGWYHFVTKEYVRYQVLKNEIIGIGISMNGEEVQEYESKFENL